MSEEKRERAPQDLGEAAELNGEGGEREEIALYTEWAKNRLAQWGIKNLSTIEGVHLRKIVEEVMPEVKKDKELLREGKIWISNTFEVEEEAAARWLERLYGIRAEDIPRVFIVEDNTTGKKYKYEITMKKNGEEKYKKLLEKGHDVDTHYQIADEFEPYIENIRAQAHHEE